MFKLKLNNYRGFLNEEFNFSRVNILIGENSAGKSSILKFLLALKQSLRTPNNKESNITLSNDETDLGNYKEMIFNHEVHRNLSFSFEFQKDYFDFFLNEGLVKKEVVTNYLGGEISTPTTIDFELTSDLSNHKNIKTKIFNENLGIISFIYSKNNNKAEKDIYIINDSPKCTIHFTSFYYKKDFIFDEIEYEKEAFLTIITSDLKESIKNTIANKEDINRIYWSIAFLLITQNYIRLHLARIDYINPLLSEPAKRIYLSGDTRNITKIRNIKDLTDYLSTNTVAPKFKDELSKILSDFGIADVIHVKQEKDGYTRELRITINGLDNNIKDVGFGVSLQLPIFAQALISENRTVIRDGRRIRKGETLLIEQPEVHLHPNLQAKFVDALLKIGSNNVYFIETHSEHIIRKLQLIVKESKHNTKSEDISIHYFKKSGKDMIKSFHQIDQETGKLEPKFPKGFYDVSYELAFQLMD